MARSVSDPFAEHVTIMKGLYQEYQKPEDVETVASIRRATSDMRALCSKRDAEVKSIIRDLSEDVSHLQACSVYPHAEGSHERRVASLEADIEDMRQSVAQLSASNREAEVQHRELAERTADAVKRAKEVAAQWQKEELLLRQQLSLYTIISKVNWRTDAGVEGRVAGTVSDPSTHEIRPFDFDPHQASHFETVNKLWQLLM